MSREKQIDEMAKVMCDRCKVIFNCTSTEMCSECTADAEALYNAGYRKQSEGEWVMQEYPLARCSVCGVQRNSARQYLWKYCPNCGARMKGGAK